MSKLASSLSRGIVAVFSRLDIQADELLTGPLNHTNLPWQVPPIICDDLFNDIPFWEYFDVGVSLNEEAFYNFYYEAMLCLRNQTHLVMDHKGYRNVERAFRCSRKERNYWLPAPEGFPGQMLDSAGALFSMECAHVLKMAGSVVEVYETDDDYWVKTRSGYEVGVRGGLPIVSFSEWDTDMSGVIPDLLRMPRGDTFVGCDYDLIAKLRSFLWDSKKQISRNDFLCADYALQTLRIIGMTNVNPILLPLMRNLKDVPIRSARRRQVFENAISLVEDKSLSDRSKVQGLRQMLVPELMNKGGFTRNFFSYTRQVPPMLDIYVMERIRSNLQIMLEKETR